MKELSMQVVNPCCAGIDVGSRFHKVAIDQNRANVKEFGVYTKDHNALIDWFKASHITSVAMESTGSYWQTLHDALLREGFEVQLVNGNQTKNVKGKKTDVLDCMWIQKLHSLGLLSGSFLPSADIQCLRTYHRHRQHLIAQCSKYINKMQKAMRMMNIRLDVAVNDIMGVSGRAIVEAILAGETNPVKLASLANHKIRKSKEEIALALEGNRREDLLFELKECLSLHDIYLAKLNECDQELDTRIQQLLDAQKSKNKIDAFEKLAKAPSKYSPRMDVETLSLRFYGVNLMAVPGIGAGTLLCLLTQIGHGFHKFPTSKHFCSWLRLAPNNKITGGKIISSRTPKGKNQFALALRHAANSIGNQKEGELVQFFKRVAYRKDRASAITATARKLATIVYNMITKKEAFNPTTPTALTTKTKNKLIKNIRSKMQALELTKDQLNFLFENSSYSTT